MSSGQPAETFYPGTMKSLENDETAEQNPEQRFKTNEVSPYTSIQRPPRAQTTDTGGAARGTKGAGE
ncbi:hypothetical protein PHISCL_00052 [Aspergillus sclerotialis]|uniref:Uncharacterized protein n=1 Tax=Aspergillus sclerotialis TaxID=2070753 RepID=A0A3A3A218_9EURO|nr:hypothetical protein PHISCL_00052 [Aspergillus sclerotialis]